MGYKQKKRVAHAAKRLAAERLAADRAVWRPPLAHMRLMHGDGEENEGVFREMYVKSVMGYFDTPMLSINRQYFQEKVIKQLQCAIGVASACFPNPLTLHNSVSAKLMLKCAKVSHGCVECWIAQRLEGLGGGVSPAKACVTKWMPHPVSYFAIPEKQMLFRSMVAKLQLPLGAEDKLREIGICKRLVANQG